TKSSTGSYRNANATRVVTTRAAQLLARRFRSSPMCSRIDISPAGLARGRRWRRTVLRGAGRRLGGGSPLALVGRGRPGGLVPGVLVVAPGRLGDALLELLDAEAEV